MTAPEAAVRRPDVDVLVVGEALVDVVRDVSGAERRHPGGSPANVAIGLGRLGHAVRLVTQLGDDNDGDLVRGHLSAAGVDVRAHPTATGRTSTALAELDDDGSATYTFDLDWTLPPAGLSDHDCDRPGAAVVHTGSIAALLDPGAVTVERFLADRRDHAVVTYDPNLRPPLLDAADAVRPRVERLVVAAHVVKASDEDLRWLYPSSTAEDVARAWATSGPHLVVVTRGGEDVIAAAGTRLHRVPALRAEVVDTVGAGDAFMAGLIDGLIGNGAVGANAGERLAGLGSVAIAGILRRAVVVAAVTVSRPGADPPTAAELQRLHP